MGMPWEDRKISKRSSGGGGDSRPLRRVSAEHPPRAPHWGLRSWGQPHPQCGAKAVGHRGTYLGSTGTHHLASRTQWWVHHASSSTSHQCPSRGCLNGLGTSQYPLSDFLVVLCWRDVNSLTWLWLLSSCSCFGSLSGFVPTWRVLTVLALVAFLMLLLRVPLRLGPHLPLGLQFLDSAQFESGLGLGSSPAVSPTV